MRRRAPPTLRPAAPRSCSAARAALRLASLAAALALTPAPASAGRHGAPAGAKVTSKVGAARAAAARTFFASGASAFKRGQFEAALTAFREAYELAPRPRLLFDIAACQQRLGLPLEAAESLRRYLAAATEEREVASIEARIRALEAAGRPPPPAPAAAPSLAPSVTAAAVTVVAAAPAARPLLLPVEAAPRARPLYPAWALLGTGAAATVAATITTAAAYAKAGDAQGESYAAAGLWAGAAASLVAGAVVYAIVRRPAELPAAVAAKAAAPARLTAAAR